MDGNPSPGAKQGKESGGKFLPADFEILPWHAEVGNGAKGPKKSLRLAFGLKVYQAQCIQFILGDQSNHQFNTLSAVVGENRCQVFGAVACRVGRENQLAAALYDREDGVQWHWVQDGHPWSLPDRVSVEQAAITDQTVRGGIPVHCQRGVFAQVTFKNLAIIAD